MWAILDLNAMNMTIAKYPTSNGQYTGMFKKSMYEIAMLTANAIIYDFLLNHNEKVPEIKFFDGSFKRLEVFVLPGRQNTLVGSYHVQLILWRNEAQKLLQHIQSEEIRDHVQT
eukprot:TRINITY_DN3827_c0_g1_i10.p1 TRINITY_DN3827_c0_g1~~TRINITY_DN3827_c0_g1_i10.p1  ORF type:complete len:114 (+),score=18.48 TRINITY_DN3827_c0_g1_i10:214-555(+)